MRHCHQNSKPTYGMQSCFIILASCFKSLGVCKLHTTRCSLMAKLRTACCIGWPCIYHVHRNSLRIQLQCIYYSSTETFTAVVVAKTNSLSLIPSSIDVARMHHILCSHLASMTACSNNSRGYTYLKSPRVSIKNLDVDMVSGYTTNL
jgi:hypothetical protein